MKPLLVLFLLAFAAGHAPGQIEDPTRLSHAVRPLFERIDLNIDPRLDSYSGEVAIEVSITAPTDTIRLHGDGFSITHATIDRSPDSQPVSSTFREHGYLVLRCPRVIGPGRYTLRIQFGGKYRSGPEGINKFRRDSLDYICTQMEAIYARTAFPCFDEPHFKILYQMSLRVPEKMFAASNMPVRSEVRSSGFRTVVFDTTRPTPSYLIAFVVGPYDTLTVPGTPIPVRLIGPRGFLHPAPFITRHVPAIISTLEEKAGSPFPFPKLDLAYVSGFGGSAMENSGLIIFTETAGAGDDPGRSLAQTRDILDFAAHEIGHMWLGNLVTLDWWDDLWLNEGLTTWISTEVLEQLYPEMSMEESVLDDFGQARNADLDNTVQAVRRHFRGDENVEESFSNALSYSKPNVVLRMFEEWIGRDTLRQGVQRYLRSFMWKTATTADFLSVVDTVAGIGSSLILRDFIYRPGIPLVQFDRRGSDSLAVRQDRYRTLEVEANGEPPWRIPMHIRMVRGGKESKQDFLLGSRDTVIRVSGSGEISLVVPNVGQSGYYMSRIPTDLAEQLLISKSVSLREKDDLFNTLQNLTLAGVVSPVDIIKLAGKVRPASDSTLAPAWMWTLTQWRENFVKGKEESVFDSYLEDQGVQALQSLGYTQIPGEKSLGERARGFAFALAFQRNEVQQRLVTLGRAYFADTTRRLTGSVSLYLNWLAFFEGTDSLYGTVIERLRRSNSDEERSVLLGMAANFRGKQFTEKNLDLLLRGGLQPLERLLLIRRLGAVLSISNNTAAHRERMQWLHDHERDLNALVPVDWLEGMLAHLPWDMSEVPLFESLFPPDKHTRIFQDEYRSTLQVLRRKAKLQERYGRELHDYLVSWNSQEMSK